MKATVVPQPSNAVIYARFSSHAQNEQSIDGQLRVCTNYAEKHGYKIVGSYCDAALSGKTDERPQFQRMISDSRKKQFQFVIVYKLDRFARNRYDSATYKYKLKQNGAKVLSAMEQIGDDPTSILLEAVLEASAEYYSVNLSENIKRGRVDSASKGLFVGGGIPTGYKSIGGKLVIDEEKAPIIQYAFAQYVKGVPKKKIVDELNRRGLRNANGNPYSCTSFQKALHSEKYIGVLDQCGVRIEGGCPALIDAATFERVQDRSAANKRAPAAQKATAEYLLSRKIFCGMCGAAMLGVAGKSKTGAMHYYYSCGERRRTHKCTKAHEKKDFIEWYVCEQTVDYVFTPERITLISSAIVERYNQEFNGGKIQELERRIAKLKRELDRLVDQLLILPESACAAVREKIVAAEAQRSDAEIDLSKLRLAAAIRYTEQEIAAWLCQFCKGDLMDVNFRRRIIDTFVNSVYLYDDRVVIWYNIKGGKQVSYMESLAAIEETGTLDFDDPLEALKGSYIKRYAPPNGANPNRSKGNGSDYVCVLCATNQPKSEPTRFGFFMPRSVETPQQECQSRGRSCTISPKQ